MSGGLVGVQVKGSSLMVNGFESVRANTMCPEDKPQSVFLWKAESLEVV